MSKPKPSRAVRIVCAILAAVLVGGIGLMVPRVRPYLVARYRGVGAHLHGAALSSAPLRGAKLFGAQLQAADLRGTDLTDALPAYGNLRAADLENANLRGANLRGANLQGAILRGAKLDGANLTVASYDRGTRWPAGFDPLKHGAQREKR